MFGSFISFSREISRIAVLGTLFVFGFEPDLLSATMRVGG
jgi:hypothetical protein